MLGGDQKVAHSQLKPKSLFKHILRFVDPIH